MKNLFMKEATPELVHKVRIRPGGRGGAATGNRVKQPKMIDIGG